MFQQQKDWETRENAFAAFTMGPLTDFWRQRDEAEFTGVDDIPVRFVRFRAQHHDRVVVICPGRIESYVKYAELAYDLFHLGFDVLIIGSFLKRTQCAQSRSTPSLIFSTGITHPAETALQRFKFLMYQVVASDLDGTLLSPDHTLSPYAKETLKLLTARGINFVFATGRHHVDVGQIRDNLEIKSYMITSNGARVHDLDGNLIFAHNLDRDIASDLFGVVNDNPDIITNVYRDDEWFMNRHRPEEMRFFKEAVFQYALYEPGLLEPEGVSKVFFTCDSHEQLLPLEQAINARWGDRVNVSFSTLTCLEVMAGGVSKGHALEAVAKKLGYSLKDCIAFGDGMNDAEMLSMAGKGCIMGSAHQRLKDLHPELEVIGTNADDAVPHYLRKLYLS